MHNYCIAVKENDDGLVFLRKIVPGGADKSYGVAVARLAGVEEVTEGPTRSQRSSAGQI